MTMPYIDEANRVTVKVRKDTVQPVLEELQRRNPGVGVSTTDAVHFALSNFLAELRERPFRGQRKP